jgi:hypothetical protein
MAFAALDPPRAPGSARNFRNSGNLRYRLRRSASKDLPKGTARHGPHDHDTQYNPRVRDRFKRHD